MMLRIYELSNEGYLHIVIVPCECEYEYEYEYVEHALNVTLSMR